MTMVSSTSFASTMVSMDPGPELSSVQAEAGIRYWSVSKVQPCALSFSSRRRHTRLVSDWSSDVCSSDLVMNRLFLAVHLDVDEQAIHHLRHRRVLEGLVRHHVAPMAGGVADGEENRLVLLARPFERFFSPGVPVDGIPPVLLEIGTGFPCEAIGHDRDSWEFRHCRLARLHNQRRPVLLA